MDIIDIILASKKSFTGETETLIRQAQAAMAQANQIVEDVSAIQESTEEANTAAQAAAERAETAAAQFDEMQADLSAAASELVDDKIAAATESLQSSIDEITDTTLPSMQSALEQQIQQAQQNAGSTVTFSDANTSTAKIRTASVTKNGSTSTYNVEKNYTGAGDNEDGSMTQKAIKTYITSVKTEIENNVAQQISQIEVSGGTTINIGPGYEGHIVVVDANGNIIAGDTTEENIIEALIKTGVYQTKNGVGLEIDYENKTCMRTQDATYLTQGADFDPYTMFGGRMRCNVADNGTITAFYGDMNYKEDGSSGQVMIYQPKFYYLRTPLKLSNAAIGKIIRKESIILSSTAQTGFKIHPLFLTPEGEELDYVLLPAFDGGIYDVSRDAYNGDEPSVDFATDLLTSVAGVKPIGGLNNSLNPISAERLANNRGSGWHITNMAAESANQMLEIVEFGSVNGQVSLGMGISNITSVSNYNCASITGSTSNLGNNSGSAISTVNEINGTRTTYSNDGEIAISYRGMENPWGNLWHFIGGTSIYGTGTTQGGVPHICKNFNYSNTITDDYESVGFCVPSNQNWASGFGYGNVDYDWVFIPAESSSSANSVYPIGDQTWTTTNLNNINEAVAGGSWSFKDYNGPFCYAFDKLMGTSIKSYGAKLMFIPTKNTIYEANHNAWLQRVGG